MGWGIAALAVIFECLTVFIGGRLSLYLQGKVYL